MAVSEDAEFTRAITEEIRKRGLKEIPNRFPKGFWDDVYERLPEVLKNKWDLNSMAGIWKQRKRRLSAIVANELAIFADTDERGQDVAELMRRTMGSSPNKKGPGDIGEEWLDYLDRRIEERMNRLLAARGGRLAVQPDDPPMPPKVGKKELGSKRHISARADSNLVDLFELEAKSRFHGNASRTLDWVLWNFFGKPRLSFELRAQAQGCFAQEEERKTVGEQ